MRDILAKLMTGSMIAGAALLVSACGKTEPATNDTANVVEMNAEDSMMNGTTSDMMTNTDAAMGADANMAADVNAANAANAADATNASANATNASNAN
ncbi:hypothetical protein [Sphingomonas cavernae]|uniref:Circumsporozoite protein n=1 Tax=Sphingomonas cavernae TaxID=2320861 RepID=A0A418W634_9SPHN|nr:hypothetical protein [Sphingomonas cavernae]RJF85434.1 hypothetical protein D3876_15955 [Sphingomonas cavernae]